MAFELDADPTSATMNSYATIAEADDYFAGRFDPLDDEDDGNTKWAGFSDSKKAALLVTASRELDTFNYGGLQVAPDQPMQWPRTNIYGRDSSYIYPSDELPALLKQACFELAYWKWTESDRAFSDTDIEQLESYKAGPVDYKAKAGAKNFPRIVLDLINSIGPGTLISTGSASASAKRIQL